MEEIEERTEEEGVQSPPQERGRTLSSEANRRSVRTSPKRNQASHQEKYSKLMLKSEKKDKKKDAEEEETKKEEFVAKYKLRQFII